MGRIACKQCDKFEIRRHFSFRGESRWTEVTEPLGFIRVDIVPGLDATSDEYLFFQCAQCAQLLQMRIDRADGGDLHAAVLAHAASTITLKPIASSTVKQNSTDSGFSAAPAADSIEASSKLTDSEEARWAELRATYSMKDLDEPTVRSVFSALEKLRSGQFKLRRMDVDYRHCVDTFAEFWRGQDEWVFAADGVNKEGEFHVGTDINFALYRISDEFLDRLTRDQSKAEKWRGLESNLLPKDAKDLDKVLPWVQKNLAEIESKKEARRESRRHAKLSLHQRRVKQFNKGIKDENFDEPTKEYLFEMLQRLWSGEYKLRDITFEPRHCVEIT